MPSSSDQPDPTAVPRVSAAERLRRLGAIVGALLLAGVVAWVGLGYNSRDITQGAAQSVFQIQELQATTLPRGPDATAARALALPGWQAQKQPVSMGWTKNTVWVRMTLANTTDTAHDAWLEVAPPRLTHIRLHELGADGTWRTQTSGVAIAAENRPVHMADIVFPLQTRLAPFERRVVVVEANSDTTSLSMNFALHEPADFVGLASQSNMLDLLLIGSTFALGSISLIVGLALRQAVQLLLGVRSVVVSGWLLLQLGFLAMIFPPDAVAWLSRQTVWIAVLSLLVGTAFLWLFLTRSADFRLPRWIHWVFAALIALPIGATSAVALGFVTATAMAPSLGIMSGATVIFTLPISAWLVWRGQFSASTILLTSSVALVLNSPAYIALLNVGGAAVIRQFISPIPVLIVAAVYFVGATFQLARERKNQEFARWQAHAQAMALLEGKVTERTAELQVARDDAQAANAAKSVFMAKVSHELRTPMHAVLGYTNLALREDLPEQAVRKLGVARRAGEQMVSQINDLLDYARMGHDQLRLDVAVFALPALVEGVAERAQLICIERGNSFESMVAGTLSTWLHGDATRIEQVLMILLNNAAHYTRGGAVTLRVNATPVPADVASLGAGFEAQAHAAASSHAALAPYGVRFTVSDTGSGMTPEVIARIFQPFERGDAVDRDGLGLGLPIAQHLLGLMGSALEVSSKPGAGSVFTFALALNEADESLGWQSQAMPQRRTYAGYRGATCRLLVLEDNAISRQYLQELLGDLGFVVVAVGDLASAAAELAREGGVHAHPSPDAGGSGARDPRDKPMRSAGFDAFLVDQHLARGESGWDFIRLVRTCADGSDVARTRPVMMLSAALAQLPGDWPDAPGVDMHLLKPLDEGALLDGLGQLLTLDWVEAVAPRVADGARHDDPWQELQILATEGSVTGLTDWLQRNAELGEAHPGLTNLIDGLNFTELARIAAQQSGTHPA